MILNINVNLSRRLIFSPSAAEVLRRLHPKTIETLYFSMTKLAFATGRVANLFFDRSAPSVPIREQQPRETGGWLPSCVRVQSAAAGLSRSVRG